MATKTSLPTSYYGCDNMSASWASKPIGKSESNTTDYAMFTVSTRSSSYFEYKFAISGIPSGATINSVVCSARMGYSGSAQVSGVPTTTMGLYSGSTLKGSTITMDYSNPSAVYTINGGSSWNLTELASPIIRTTLSRGSTSAYASISPMFYGATLTVTYTVPSTQKRVTVSYNGTQISSNDQDTPVALTCGTVLNTTVSAGATKTLNCSGKIMPSNVSVGNRTLTCNGKYMSGNIVVSVSS